jgi:hypothetical protein
MKGWIFFAFSSNGFFGENPFGSLVKDRAVNSLWLLVSSAGGDTKYSDS